MTQKLVVGIAAQNLIIQNLSTQIHITNLSNQTKTGPNRWTGKEVQLLKLLPRHLDHQHRTSETPRTGPRQGLVIKQEHTIIG
jgi:hypothetical protein